MVGSEIISDFLLFGFVLCAFASLLPAAGTA
jgi:hypothetical protein